MFCKSEYFIAGMMEKRNDSCSKILAMGSKKSKGVEKMIESGGRYGYEFKNIDYSGITDIVDVVAFWYHL